MFEAKTWWVTGASSGIGAALAVALSQAGARVILSGRNLAALAQTAARLPGESLTLPFEATAFGEMEAIVERAWSWRGGVDGLVNNAGVSQRSLAAQTAFAVYERIVAVDLLGPIALTQALLPRLIAQGGGRIVAVSSLAGVFGAPLRSAYSAAKFGLIGYHESVRAETAQQGIHVLVVTPGSVRTNVSRNALDASGAAHGESDINIENGMAPEEAAARILDALTANARELVLAEGMEAQLAQLRRSDPEKLFDLLALSAARNAESVGVKSS